MSAMRMADVERCILCGAPGEGLYSGLRDRMLGVEGSFNHRSCRPCGLIWMDPQPVAEDLGRCYKGFYSVDAPDDMIKGGAAEQRLKRAMREAIFCGFYGYRHIHRRHTLCWAGPILRRIPVAGAAALYGWEALMPCWNDVKGSLVIDVGCGKGQYLGKLRDLGCTVLGIEPDEAGCAILNKKGIPAFHGSIEGARLPDASAAHITLRHVIEHLSDPVSTIRECYRVLRPGGRLVLRTPNAAGLTHAIFKSDWYQLDPPRHLFIFSPRSLGLLWKKAGFTSCRMRTISFSAAGVYDNSVMIRKIGAIGGMTIGPERGRWVFAARMNILAALGCMCGEEIEAVLTKGA